MRLLITGTSDIFVLGVHYKFTDRLIELLAGQLDGLTDLQTD